MMDDRIETDTDMVMEGETEKTGGNDVKNEFKTVAHVIRQLTDLTGDQAEQLEEMLIDGFTDTNGVADKTSAYETLVSVINEPNTRNGRTLERERWISTHHFGRTAYAE